MPVKAIGDAALEVRLTPEDLAQINSILLPGEAAGRVTQNSECRS